MLDTVHILTMACGSIYGRHGRKRTACNAQLNETRGTVTGYQRNRTVKNLDGEGVRAVLQELRDTLGRKVPRHNEISLGVVERKRLSVSGVPRNVPNLNVVPPDVQERRADIRQRFGFRDLVDDVGLAGVVDVAQEMVAQIERERQTAIDAEPKKVRVAPTE